MVANSGTGKEKDTGIPSKERLQKLKDDIHKLQDNFTLATKNEEEQRN